MLVPMKAHGGCVCDPDHRSYLVSFGAMSFDETGGYRPTDRQQDFRHPDQSILIWPVWTRFYFNPCRFLPFPS